MPKKKTKSFTTAVRLKAMVACGRRCCLCHKYCGVNIECAHIEQKADGGPNTLANCIPLCFDCHAIVGHYNDKHPKGNKFTTTELKKHRDHWYKQVKSGVIFLPTDYDELDKALFAKIHKVLGGSSRMQHFKAHDYGSSYDKMYDERLNAFLHLTENPETEFLTFSMELVFADLKAAIKDYAAASVGKIYRDKNNKTNGIPGEWLESDGELKQRHIAAVPLMNAKASKIWQQYSKFISEARRILKVKIEEVVIKEL